MTKTMIAWKNVKERLDEKYMLEVCCSKLSKQKIIIKIDDKWNGYDNEGNDVFKNLKFCPFCGEKFL